MKSIFKRILSLSLALLTVTLLVLSPLMPQAQALTYNGSSSYKSGKYYTNLTNVTLTGDQRTDLVNVAKSQIGYQEGSSSSYLSGTVKGNGNYTEYGRWYGLQDMWCAMFVSWCAHVAGIPTSVVPSHSYTPTGLNWFKNKGQAYSRATVAAGGYTPQPGDIIYFKSSRNQNITNHIGIVTSYSGGTVYTIEGNTSSATISTNGGAVCAKSYSITNTYIVYICKPAFTSQAGSGLKDVVFDADYYSSAHADLKEAFGTDADALYQHFLDFGIKEGRQASPMFDLKYYLANNAHVQEAIGSTTDYTAAYKYFIETGYKKKAKTAEPADLGDTFYAKISYRSGKNLSLSDTNVIIYPDSEKPAQVWQFTRQSNGSYKIVNAKNSLSLTAAGSAKTPGTNVELGVGDGSAGQSWFLYKNGSKYVLRPYCSSYCVLDVAGGGTADATNVQISTNNNTNAQLFTINKVDYSASEAAVDLGEDVFVKISNVASGNFLATSNYNLVSATDKATATRVFRLMHKADGSYRIVGQNSNKTVTVEGAVDADGTNVHTTTNENSTAQRWYIYRCGDYYTFRPVLSESCRLEVADGSTTSGANVQIGTASGGNEQLFNITKVDYLKVVAPKDLGDDFTARLTNSASGKNMTLNGTNVISNTASTAAAQYWRFIKQDDGSYIIYNQKNGKVLDLATANGGDGTNVQISDPSAAVAPNWFIYVLASKYALRPAGSEDCLLTVDGGSTADGTNIQINTFVGTSKQRFSFEITENITSAEALGITDAQMEVLRNIIYAVETGGQVYGNKDYSAFVEAYANSTEEHAITIGAGQWYGTEAKTLLDMIRTADPTTFATLDTAGIADELDTADWSTYQLSETSAKAKCIVNIISSDVGIACQDQLLDKQMISYMAEARNLGVTHIDALMECANIRHQGGLGALKRVLGKTATPYTLDNIYAALQTDTGNEVGTYTSRQKFVYENLKKYITNAVDTDTTVKYLPACDSSEVSIVVALQNVGVENVTPEYRMRLAIANGITDYAYTADQNVYLLDLLKAGQLIDPEGVTLTGWYTFTGGKRYYYDTNGNQVTGWLTDGGKTYYLDPSTGAMATGTVEIDGATYDFGTDGVLVVDTTCAHESHDTDGHCIVCREDVGHNYTSVITGATCTEQGYTTYSCSCGHTYVGDYTATTGHTYVDGYCEVCEEPDPNPTVVPTLTLSHPSLAFDSQIQYNIYYTAQDLGDVEEMGLITFSEATSDGTIENAAAVIPGYITNGSYYMVHTNGIAAKNLGDAMYFKVYAKLSDGNYVYSDMAGYHAVAYAKGILAQSTNEQMKRLVVSMLNYGAAAQVHFNYKTDSLMNAFLSDEQKALAPSYSADLVSALVTPDTSKSGSFAKVDGSYKSIYPSVSFDGAFGINFYFNPANTLDGNLTLYYWTQEDYATATVLTPENASGTFTATSDYRTAVSGIAAKELDDTVFVAAIYESDGVNYASGVIAYSLGAYCVDRAANGSATMSSLAKATAVYGSCARDYFTGA